MDWVDSTAARTHTGQSRGQQLSCVITVNQLLGFHSVSPTKCQELPRISNYLSRTLYVTLKGVNLLLVTNKQEQMQMRETDNEQPKTDSFLYFNPLKDRDINWLHFAIQV